MVSSTHLTLVTKVNSMMDNATAKVKDLGKMAENMKALGLTTCLMEKGNMSGQTATITKACFHKACSKDRA